MSDFLDRIYSNYEKAFNKYKFLLTTDYDTDSYPPLFAEHMTFGREFPGALIRKPKYKDCIFIGTRFESADGALSRFHNCSFDSCILNNCDFRYCDINNSNFSSKINELNIFSCNFSFGNFINSSFSDTRICGCSFRQMQLDGTAFANCIIENSSFEQSYVKNCSFENLDLRKVGVRYCTFENNTFKNVTFHILDLAKNYGLIQQLRNSDSVEVVAFKNDMTMTLNEAVDYILELIPYYLETEQFYELINVYAVHNMYDEIFTILPIAFERVVTNLDFSSLQDLCTLVVKLNICTDKQLRDFYFYIKQLIIPNKFPHYLRKSYNTYIENIRYILVDNPYNNPEAELLLKTDIESLSDADMGKLLMSIETNIKELAPHTDVRIQLTHHSPYDVVVFLCGTLPEILAVCQTFYYCLGGIKTLSELRKSKKEKTTKVTSCNPESKNIKQEKKKRIEISLGKNFTFKYEKEYTEHVEALEYTIK